MRQGSIAASRKGKTIYTASTINTTQWSISYNAKQCFSTSSSSPPPPSSSSSPPPPPMPPSKKGDNDNEEDEVNLVFGDGIDSYTKKLMQNRHEGIKMNPKGISQHVLPGEYIVKTNPRTGDKKMVGLERSMGFFWDLKVCFFCSFMDCNFVRMLVFVHMMMMMSIHIHKY